MRHGCASWLPLAVPQCIQIAVMADGLVFACQQCRCRLALAPGGEHEGLRLSGSGSGLGGRLEESFMLLEEATSGRGGGGGGGGAGAFTATAAVAAAISCWPSACPCRHGTHTCIARLHHDQDELRMTSLHVSPSPCCCRCAACRPPPRRILRRPSGQPRQRLRCRRSVCAVGRNQRRWRQRRRRQQRQQCGAARAV